MAKSGLGLFFRAALVALVAFFVWRAFRPKTKWHEGEAWQNFLNVYDAQVATFFAGCTSKLIATRFGSTQVHACGNPTDRPVFLFHGAATSSLLWGEWIVPAVQAAGFYTVSVDFICDSGRSVPLNQDPANCPRNQSDFAVWVREIKQELKIEKPVSLVGYSYGSFIAASTALHASDIVDKLILMAPACVVAPLNLAWLARALLVPVIPGEWFFRYMSADGNWSFDSMKPHHQQLLRATQAVAATSLAVQPYHFPDTELQAITSSHPTLLVVGDKETVIDSAIAVETAKRNGIELSFWQNAGHLMYGEYPREPLKDVVADFLKRA